MNLMIIMFVLVMFYMFLCSFVIRKERLCYYCLGYVALQDRCLKGGPVMSRTAPPGRRSE